MDLAELREAYEDLAVTRSQVRARVRREYKKIIDQRIAEEIESGERAFARKLRAALEDGATGTEIREEVLHTNTWSIWVKWRDLAGVGPERDRKRDKAAEARAEKDARKPYRIEDGSVWVTRGPDGAELEREIRMTKIGRRGNKLLNPTTYNDLTVSADVDRWDDVFEKFEDFRVLSEFLEAAFSEHGDRIEDYFTEESE